MSCGDRCAVLRAPSVGLRVQREFRFFAAAAFMVAANGRSVDGRQRSLWCGADRAVPQLCAVRQQNFFRNQHQSFVASVPPGGATVGVGGGSDDSGGGLASAVAAITPSSAGTMLFLSSATAVQSARVI